MYITYDDFIKKLNSKFVNGQDFYIELLKTVIDNPTRYTGIFRVSSAKTKLIQNVTQSHEIKFGDFMEYIVTDYIGLLGYNNLPKNIGKNEKGDKLNTDQLFTSSDEKTLYLVEQKIRDDHDSTKKRGQFSNFIYKIELLKRQHPNQDLVGVMWFIDDGLKKNKNYYRSEMDSYMMNYNDISLKIYYGGEIFDDLFHAQSAWTEITNYLKQNKQERSQEQLYIPDFDKSSEILKALKSLPTKYIKKLKSNDEKYIQLRAELFPTGINLSQI